MITVEADQSEQLLDLTNKGNKFFYKEYNADITFRTAT